jgi:hypothetical protein
MVPQEVRDPGRTAGTVSDNSRREATVSHDNVSAW